MTERERLKPGEWFPRVGYRAHPGQAPIHASRARYRVAVCGRRWGKSSRLAAHEAELYLCTPLPPDVPGYRVWIVGPTYDHTEKVFRAILAHTVQGTGYYARNGQVDRVLRSLRCTPRPRLELNWGTVVEGKSADNPNSLVGEGVDFLIVDEAAKIAGGKRIWEQYLQPCLADKHGRALFVSTPEGYNWLHELYRRGQGNDPDWASWQSPTWVNTTSFPGARDDPEIERACRVLTDDYFRQEYGAEFTALAGRVYPEFTRDVHAIGALPGTQRDRAEWTRYRSIDFGYTNPFCCVWVMEDPDGRWYVYDEHYQGGWCYEDHAAAIRERGTDGFARTVADPADPQGVEQLTRLGVFCERAKTTRSTGIELVRQRLKVQPDGRPRLYVLERCMHTIAEFENYRYPETRVDQAGAEAPLKKDDHAMDCLKNLALTLHTGGQWEQVR